MLPLLVFAYSNLAIGTTVRIGTEAAAHPAFDHKWKRFGCHVLVCRYVVSTGFRSNVPNRRSFGSGHSSITLRDDWRSQLTQAVNELGLSGVRYHGIFDDDMGPVVISINPDGSLNTNFSLIDRTWDYVSSASLHFI